jgi:iron complex outermembrane receptor protein
VLFINILFASESVTSLLNQIEKSEDLSLKTKRESLGISYVITRYQLDMMQARYLRDVLKNTVIGYEISRYGVLDPWSANNLPYSSSGIRVFIDNQEITTGKYDNGLFLLGNINLSFVDHIEIYYLSPSYSISTEPAYVIIKLYSKNPERDDGKKVGFTYGSYGSNSQNADLANGEKNYYLHLSRSEVNHKNFYIDDKAIKRDDLNYHFLWTYKYDGTKILLNAIYHNQNPFMGMSMDGKLDDGYEKYKKAHFGIEKKFDTFNLKYMIDYMKDYTYFYENTGLFIQKTNTPPYVETINEVKTQGYDLVNTLNLDKESMLNSHRLIYGVNLRNKLMNYEELKLNGENQNYTGIKRQNIVTLFVEDNYQKARNLVFTFGCEMSKYYNDVIKDYNLYQYKAGTTYLYDKKNIFKISYQHIEYSIPPYLYKTFYSDNILDPQKNDVLIAKYKKKIDRENEFEFVGFYGINKKFPIADENGKLTNYNKNIYVKMLDLKYHKNYEILNDLIVDYIYLKLENINLHRSHRVAVLNTHRYKKFAFFENIVYKNNEYKTDEGVIKKTGIDLSLGIKYNYNKNLTFSLKGENLLNDAYENSFIRVLNFNPADIRKVDTELIDRKVTAGVEYWF